MSTQGEVPGRDAYVEVCREVAGGLTELRGLVPAEFSEAGYQQQLKRLGSVQRQIRDGVVRIAAVLERIGRPVTAVRLKAGEKLLFGVTTECVVCTDAELARKRGQLWFKLMLAAADLEGLLGECEAEIEAAGAAGLLDRQGAAADGRPPTRPPRMTVGLANRIAVRLADRDRSFVDGGAREWARAIAQESGRTCSRSTVVKTPLWKATMEQTGRGRGPGRTPKTVALTPDLEAVTAQRRRHETQNRLIADEEQEAGEAVRRSGLPDQRKREALEGLESGEMTASQATDLARSRPAGKGTAG